MSFNDRPKSNPSGSDSILPKPEVHIIVDGSKVFKPGMKSYFMESSEVGTTFGTDKNVITGSYCSCDTVQICTCEAYVSCSCESYEACSCDSHCSCDSVCTCENVCTCESNCSCDNYSSGSGGGGWVPCTGPCACVPVH